VREQVSHSFSFVLLQDPTYLLSFRRKSQELFYQVYTVCDMHLPTVISCKFK